MRRASNRVFIAIALIWFGLISAGLSALVKHQYTPGLAAAAMPARWPSSVALRPSGGKFTLVMFLNPHCECSAASVEELNQLLGKNSERLTANVYYVTSRNDPNPDSSPTRSSAAAIPGVNVADDPGGAIARKFDAFTSGQTFLYNPDGELIFHGGITDGRAHEGDNPGSDAINLLIAGQQSAIDHTPVYGCELFDPVKDGLGAAWPR